MKAYFDLSEDEIKEIIIYLLLVLKERKVEEPEIPGLTDEVLEIVRTTKMHF